MHSLSCTAALSTSIAHGCESSTGAQRGEMRLDNRHCDGWQSVMCLPSTAASHCFFDSWMAAGCGSVNHAVFTLRSSVWRVETEAWPAANDALTCVGLPIHCPLPSQFHNHIFAAMPGPCISLTLMHLSRLHVGMSLPCIYTCGMSNLLNIYREDGDLLFNK